MKYLKAIGWFALVWALSGTLIACGGDDDDDDGDDKQGVEACIQACGEGCPAPEYWVCASDGDRYCNECVIDCYDLTVADDSTCASAESDAGTANDAGV
jgi:hypothetical protein